MPKTVFSIGTLGFFECNYMAFGLTNAPVTFQRLMECTMGELHLRECLIYLDDIIIISDYLESHFKRLKSVFQHLEKAGLKLKGGKREVFQCKVKYQGHVESGAGVKTDPDKIEVVRNWKVPANVKVVCSFLGFAVYCGRFIPYFANLAKPLNDLLVGDSTEKGKKSKSLW